MTGNLDINTPLGQQSLHDELIAASIFEKNSPGYRYIHTDKSGSAAIDAMIVLNSKLAAVAETKCRYNMGLHKFATEFSYKWLITKNKIDKAQRVAALLQTPLIGILFLVPSGLLLVKKLWCPQTGWKFDLSHQTTTTQATINGGSATRDNYFIDMTEAKVMEDK